MTFILGMQFNAGIILFGDTLESDGITRRYRPKLESFTTIDGENENEWGVCWGGSGSATVVDKFSGRLNDALKQIRDYDRQKLESLVDSCLESIRADYREEISIVLGLYGKRIKRNDNGDFISGVNEIHLYRGYSRDACLSPEDGYCVAGMDVTLASFLLGALHRSSMGFDEAKKLGVFVTAMMKKYAEGVGGSTTTIAHSYGSYGLLGGWKQVHPREIKTIEDEYTTADAEALLELFWSQRCPGAGSSHRDHRIAALKKKLKRSASQRSKGPQ